MRSYQSQMGPDPVTCVLIRRGNLGPERQLHTRRRPCDNGGRDGSGHCMPRSAKDRPGPEAGEARNQACQQPASRPRPHSRETINARCFRPPHWGAPSWWCRETHRGKRCHASSGISLSVLFTLLHINLFDGSVSLLPVQQLGPVSSGSRGAVSSNQRGRLPPLLPRSWEERGSAPAAALL